MPKTKEYYSSETNVQIISLKEAGSSFKRNN